ncbi:creatininase family protein [Actinomycetospora sp. CA-101289]|uniref:creatininase family protein n=1 Tax=Actinomycetospora sp. CA-101289 TaxID=3239893 RepID=UPI003D9754D2
MPISWAITDLTTNEVAECIQESDAVLVPIGAVEQHGPSCPVGTDMILAQYIAPRVAEAANILYGPVLPVGDSLVFTSFPGTIALRPSTLFAATVDYVTSLHRAGFRRFLMLGTHWDNHFPVAAAMSELADSLPEMRFAIKDFWEFSLVQKIMQEEFDEAGGHADAADVAMLLAIDQSYVRQELLTAEFPPVKYQVGRTLLRQFMTESGVIGSDQRKATVEAGERLIEAVIDGYLAVIEDLRH